MDNEKYLRSITDEINALKDRIQNFIGHKLTIGTWKESILRTLLRRHLPSNIGVGTGFFVTSERCSQQIDILLYDKMKPIIFQDGDCIIVTPDAVKGLIEVKTRAVKSTLESQFSKLADDVELLLSVATGDVGRRFFGIYYYEINPSLDNLLEEAGAAEILTRLTAATRHNENRIINCVAIKESFFIRYWRQNPSAPEEAIRRWHAYKINSKSPAYFVHNVVEHMCPESVLANNYLWFLPEGKEQGKLAHSDL